MCKLSEEQINTINKFLVDEIALISGEEEINDNFNNNDILYDLGLDSLGIVDIVFYLEYF